MVDILVFVTVVALIVHTFVCLAYFVSSIWEKEKRAGIFAGLQLVLPPGLMGFVFYLSGSGFFDSIGGVALLGAGVILIVLVPLLLVIKTHPNNKALEGTKGFIVGSVQRFDERETVFSRNRSLRPGSEQFEQFYAQHPEYAEYDAARRKLGGPVGKPGSIDTPHEKPNLAASVASTSFALHLSVPEVVTPAPFAAFKGERISLSPQKATERVKGFARHLGAGLVGITELNPLWTYSHRGEIFNENWEDWGRVGTGCNICMRVCPWSHASSLPHQLIKNLVSRNWMARRVFTLMDDVFYGKKPRAKAPPKWAKYD